MAKLEIQNLVKKYGSTLVLNDINIKINNGEFLVLVGPSGCGKSTLLNVIAGLENITAGNIIIGDKVVNDYAPKERDIAMVFQSYALYPNLTVQENISFGLQNRKLDKRTIAERVQTVAKQLQIDHLLERKPSQLSGGQRQRVAMGRAISRNPKIYLFDEPLSNLDAKLRVEMRMEIKLLHKRVANTVVYVTHDQTEAMTLADKIALLNGGKLEQIDSPIEIYRNPANIFVASFIGSPSMNLIPVTITEDGERMVYKLKNAGGQEFVVPLPKASEHAARDYSGKQVIAGIRPEHMTQPKAEKTNSSRTIEVLRLLAEPTGSDLYFSFALNGATAIGRYNPDFDLLAEKVPLQIEAEQAIFFDPNSEKRIF